MPIVSRSKKKYPGLPEFEVRVTYNPSRQSFSIGLPEFMVIPGSSLRAVTGKTQKEAEKLFGEVIEKFKQSSKTSRKVIIFDINRTPQTFVFRVAVANESTIASANESTSSYEILESSLKSNYKPYAQEKCQAVEWSPETEAFFKGLQDRMEYIVELLGEKGEWTPFGNFNPTSYFRIKDDRAKEKV